MGKDLYLNHDTYKNDNEITSNNKILVNDTSEAVHIKEIHNGNMYAGWKDKKKKTNTSNRYKALFKWLGNYNPDPEIVNIDLYTNAVKTNVVNLSHQNVAITKTVDIDNIDNNERVNQSVNIPTSSLYQINQDPNSKYVIEVDPRFASYRSWLSSDYMFDSLRFDHNNMHKRLGDGYYEQKLINQQIANLTGRRFLTGYANNEEQYKALMDSGIKFAKKFNLTPGVSLTPALLSNLTDNIVWFETVNVTLKNGSTVKALKPQVYLVKNNATINETGALISANRIITKNNIENAGNINTNTLMVNNIQNTGILAGNDKLIVMAENDIINSGKVTSQNGTYLQGKNIINATSTKHTEANYGGGNEFSATYINKVGELSADHGDVVLKADNNITNLGANIIAADGQINLDAGNKVSLTTLDVSRKEHIVLDGDNYDKTFVKQEVGGNLSAKGNIVIKGKLGVDVKATKIDSDKGIAYLKSDQDVNLTTGKYEEQASTGVKYKQKGALNSTTVSSKHEHKTIKNIASDITGKKVIIDAGNNANIIGSNVISDDETTIVAKNDVNIKNDKNYQTQKDEHYEKKSGVMTSGFGFTIGSKQTKDTYEQDNTIVSEAKSQVGSLDGKVNIQAGNIYHQTSSDVLAKGDINVTAQAIVVDVHKDILQSNETHEMKQSGLTIAFSSPVTDALMAAANTVKGAKDIGKSKNTRVNGMAAFNTGMQAYNAAQAVGGITDALSKGNIPTDANGGNFTISATIGSQKNISTQDNKYEQSVKSNIFSENGAVNLIATGGGENSNIEIIGSDVLGTQGTHLAADNNANILSSADSFTERSNNKSSGWNAGVAATFGQGGWSFGFTAGGNKGRGHGNGDGVSHVNSHVGDKTSNTTVIAGGDTNIIGSQLLGKKVDVDTTNLNIESQQDTATYDGKQENISGQITVGYGASGNLNYSKSKIKANHASVVEQSAVLAGDDGYSIKIKSHTDLKGGLITSTAKAELEAKNSFTTGTLTHSDIENISEHKASGYAVGGSAAISGEALGQGSPAENSKLANQGPANGNSFAAGPSTPGYGSDKDKQISITKAGINTANIAITNKSKQQELTGKSVEQTIKDIKTNITTDTAEANSGKLTNTFDKNRVQKEIDLQVKVTQEFGNNVAQLRNELSEYVSKNAANIKDDPNNPNQNALDLVNKERNELLTKDETNQLSRTEKQRLNQLNKAIENAQLTKLIVGAVAGVLSGPNAGGIAGDIANAAAPFAANAIGQYFKQIDPKTGRSKEGSREHIASHVALGALTAALNKNNVLSGAIAGGASEALAPLATKLIYGKNKKLNELTQAEKQNVLNVVNLATSSVSAIAGQSATNIASNTQIANVAVSDNALLHKQFKHNLSIRAQKVFDKAVKLGYPTWEELDFNKKIAQCNGDVKCKESVNKNLIILQQQGIKNLEQAATNGDFTKEDLNIFQFEIAKIMMDKSRTVNTNESISWSFALSPESLNFDTLRAIIMYRDLSSKGYTDKEIEQEFVKARFGEVAAAAISGISAKKRIATGANNLLSKVKAAFTSNSIKINDKHKNYPDGISYNKDLPNHIKNVESLNQSKGRIIGGHNADEFYKFVKENNIKFDVKPTKIKGISQVTYQIPAKDRAGNIIPGKYKSEELKTIYDPNIWSDKKILELSVEAGRKGYKAAMESPKGQANIEINGIPFRIYVDKSTSTIRNVHLHEYFN